MEGWGLESSRQGTAGAGRDMDELGIEKERKGILARWFCSRGKKSGGDWRKRDGGVLVE